MDSDKGKNTLDTETKIKLLIALINDEGRHKLDNSMDKLVTRLSENFASNKNYIKRYLIKAILHIPMKTIIYANLITRLYYKNKQDDSIKTFIEEILRELLQEMNKEINAESSSKWNPDILKRFIRFYCECYSHHLISFASMSALLDILLSKAKTDHKLSQLYLYLIVSNMHIIYDCLMLENKEYLDNLIKQIDNGIEDDKFVNKCNRIVKDDNINSSYLNYVWSLIKDNLDKKNHNRTKYILNLSASKLNEGERLEINFENELNINYDYLLYANGVIIGNGDLLQELNMVDEIKSTTDISKFERYLIREYLGEIISSFENNLEKVYFYFNNFLNFYGVEDTWEDNIRDNMNDTEEKDNLSNVINYSMVEMIFSSILNTHNQDIFKVTYLSSLLYYVTQQNKNISAISSKIISKIINNIHSLDVQSITNFSNFLSFYISNLQYKFRIESSQDYSQIHLKGQIFRTLLLESLINLGNKSKLEELSTYSPQLQIDQFLSSFSERANWKFYFGEQYHYDTVVINDHIQSKKEYHTWRDKFESSGNDFLYVLMSCLFFYKSKTLTHLREILNSYKETIEYLITKDKQNVMLKALFDVWGHSSVYIRFVVDYLFNNNLLEHDVLVKFLITERLSFKNELWWKNLVYLMDLAVIHPFKALERSRLQLAKEQQALAHSDDTNQVIIIGQIEQLEVYVEKMNSVCDNLPVHTLTELIQLYSSSTQQENKEATELVNEVIVQLCRRFKRNLIENLNKIESNYKALSLAHVEMDRLFENFNSL